MGRLQYVPSYPDGWDMQGREVRRFYIRFLRPCRNCNANTKERFKVMATGQTYCDHCTDKIVRVN